MDIVKVNDKAISNVIEDDYLLEEMSDLDIENEMNESSMSTRSGLTLISTNDVACQADFVNFEQPIIRYRRKCTEQIKTICAKVSSTISEEEKMSNLRCILSIEEDMSDNRMKVGQLPTDQNVLTALLATSGGEVHQSAQHELEVFINSVVAVTWVVNNKTWYLGYITEICKDDNTCLVDHLERVYQERNDLWRFPK